MGALEKTRQGDTGHRETNRLQKSFKLRDLDSNLNQTSTCDLKIIEEHLFLTFTSVNGKTSVTFFWNKPK